LSMGGSSPYNSTLVPGSFCCYLNAH
jgi:hypothetical protein